MTPMTTRTPEESLMARFEIQHYELHVGTTEIEAPSVADAIKRFFAGDGDMLNGSEYIGACREIGMLVDDNPQFAEELRKLGVQLSGSFIPSIRSVRHMENTDE